MKKWFEWQQKYQENKNVNEAVFIKKNILPEIQFIINFLDDNKKYIREDLCHAFSRKTYIDTIAKDYELDKGEVSEWIDDPEYIQLLDQSGKHFMIHVPEIISKKFKNIIKNLFPIDHNTAEIKIHNQKPGQMFPLHYDRVKYADYEVDKNKEGNILRYLVFLKDQQPGQTFLLGDEFIKWKAGDVISWNQTNHMHGSANFGYHDRPALVITGKKLDN